jgi:hypothetical protein
VGRTPAPTAKDIPRFAAVPISRATAVVALVAGNDATVATAAEKV